MFVFVFFYIKKNYSSTVIEFPQHEFQKSAFNAYDQTEFIKKISIKDKLINLITAIITKKSSIQHVFVFHLFPMCDKYYYFTFSSFNFF